MRFFFLSLFSIVFISLLTVLVYDSLTGAIPVTPNCGADRTYAFYRTLEEKARAEDMWMHAGFIPTYYEESPESFHASGYLGFMCLRRMTREELGQEHMLQRERVMTEHTSI